MNQRPSLLYSASEWIAMTLNAAREKHRNQIMNSLESKSSLFEGKNFLISKANCTKIDESLKLKVKNFFKEI